MFTGISYTTIGLMVDNRFQGHLYECMNTLSAHVSQIHCAETNTTYTECIIPPTLNVPYLVILCYSAQFFIYFNTTEVRKYFPVVFVWPGEMLIRKSMQHVRRS